MGRNFGIRVMNRHLEMLAQTWTAVDFMLYISGMLLIDLAVTQHGVSRGNCTHSTLRIKPDQLH